MKPRYDPRVFLALTLSRTAQERLSEAQDCLRTYLASWHFIPTENLHVTLKFFGEVPEDKIPAVREGCRAMARRHNPFSLHWNAIDFFGSPQSARVLFAAAEPNTELDRLAVSISQAFADIGDAKPLHPHVTLAKARREMDRGTAQMNSNMLRRLKELGRIGPEPVEVDLTTVHRDLSLMETIWVGRGVQYELRECFPLIASAQ